MLRARKSGRSGVLAAAFLGIAGAAAHAAPPRGIEAVEASSSYGGDGPFAAVDGNPTTRWSSRYEDPSWLAVRFEAARELWGVAITWERAGAAAYAVQVSDDGATWRDVARVNDGRAEETRRLEFGPVEARWVRVLGMTRLTSWGYSIIEIAFAESPATLHPAPVIPRPSEAVARPGSFAIDAETRIRLGAGAEICRGAALHLAAEIARRSGLELQVSEAPAPATTGAIVFRRADGRSQLGDEGYELDVTEAAAAVSANAPAGCFYAAVTILQLLDSRPDADARPLALAAARIVDRPRYLWRGFMLDSARHMQSPELIKKVIDDIAYHKLNRFHWHLTDDQGWRVQIDRYPRLTSVGGYRGTAPDRYGGFYTKQQIRDIVAFAAARQVMVVPEIDMPGHAQAALAAYPELSCDGAPVAVRELWGKSDAALCPVKPETFAFLEALFAELAELFPAPYVHIGGDEVASETWEGCQACRKRMAELGLARASLLIGDFVTRVSELAARRGRRIIGWQEILHGGGAPPSATVMWWQAESQIVPAVTAAGHDLIASPRFPSYLNYPSGSDGNSVRMAFRFEPAPSTLPRSQAERVLGGQANLWSEHMLNEAMIEPQIFPRLAAIAEALWSGPAEREAYAGFLGRLELQRQRFERLGIGYDAPQLEQALAERPAPERQLEPERLDAEGARALASATWHRPRANWRLPLVWDAGERPRHNVPLELVIAPSELFSATAATSATAPSFEPAGLVLLAIDKAGSAIELPLQVDELPGGQLRLAAIVAGEHPAGASRLLWLYGEPGNVKRPQPAGALSVRARSDGSATVLGGSLPLEVGAGRYLWRRALAAGRGELFGGLLPGLGGDDSRFRVELVSRGPLLVRFRALPQYPIWEARELSLWAGQEWLEERFEYAPGRYLARITDGLIEAGQPAEYAFSNGKRGRLPLTEDSHEPGASWVARRSVDGLTLATITPGVTGVKSILREPGADGADSGVRHGPQGWLIASVASRIQGDPAPLLDAIEATLDPKRPWRLRRGSPQLRPSGAAGR